MIDASAMYAETFGAAPSLTVRSPGRINIIGDHTDYCGLPVLPMAIGRAIEVAGSASAEPGIRAISTLDNTLVDSTAAGEPTGWARYLFAVLEQLAPHNQSGLGANISLDSDLPSTGGLSSSSALAIGCSTALNRLWQLGLDPQQLIDLALAAERQAAVAGGAMDQTVITYGVAGHALRIDFDPPNRLNVPIPEGFRWVAAYSGTDAPKGDSAADAYNSFVLASRAATVLLADELGHKIQDPMLRAPRLSEVRDAPAETLTALPTITAGKAADLTGGDRLGLAADRELNLRISAEHVLSEAGRVLDASAAMEKGDMAEMGRLMNESHQSLARYGSSTDNLDRLVAEACRAGAVGARVTGAGFGGWAIALTDEAHLSAVLEATELACGGPCFEAQASDGVVASLAE